MEHILYNWVINIIKNDLSNQEFYKIPDHLKGKTFLNYSAGYLQSIIEYK
jgi:hypothetical protein